MKTILAITFAVITSAAAEPVTIALKSGGKMTGNLVGKTNNEIKIETAYGVIALSSNAVNPESWTTAQSAATSKPSGKYIEPNAIVPKEVKGSAKALGASSPKSPYAAGTSDGRMVGKHDAATGKDRDGQKAMRLGKLHSQSYPKAEDQAAYAKGYHEGYNDAWHQRQGYKRLNDRNGLNPKQR